MSDTDNIETSAAPSRRRTITLTDRRPVAIDEDEWPVIGSAYSDASEVLRPSSRAWLKVRQHQDGRTIVYGGTECTESTMHRGIRAGVLSDAIPTASELGAHIRRVASLVNASDIAQDCIASLPAEEL